MQLFLVTLFVFPFLTSLTATAMEAPEVQERGHVPSLQIVNPCAFENDGKEEKREGKRTFVTSAYEGTEDQAKDQETSPLTAVSVPISVLEEKKLESSINGLQSSTDLINYVWRKGEELVYGILQSVKGFIEDPFGIENVMADVDFSNVFYQPPAKPTIITKSGD